MGNQNLLNPIESYDCDGHQMDPDGGLDPITRETFMHRVGVAHVARNHTGRDQFVVVTRDAPEILVVTNYPFSGDTIVYSTSMDDRMILFGPGEYIDQPFR